MCGRCRRGGVILMRERNAITAAYIAEYYLTALAIEVLHQYQQLGPLYI